MMQPQPPTVVLRHRKENVRKCSLRGLEEREDMRFFLYPGEGLPDLKGYLLLSFEGPLLTKEDAKCGLLLIDGTWRYAEKMCKWVDGQVSLPKRSLPEGIRTAYPRKQEDCSDPERGLASIEALAVAFHIFGWDALLLLKNYYWADEFLNLNSKFFDSK